MSKVGRKREVAKFGSELQIEAEIRSFLSNAECSVCLPYELSILEIDSILSAIKRIAGTTDFSVELAKGGSRKAIKSPSAFDIWDFIFEAVYQLPTAICSLIHEHSNSTLVWDDEERFAIIAGSRSFCEAAFPHSFSVLEHFYVQSTINDFEDEQALRAYFARLTSFGR